MPNRNLKTKNITVSKHKFRLEIYLGLEKELAWEIFPHDYSAALYAFSNKDRLNKIIEKKYVYEVKNDQR